MSSNEPPDDLRFEVPPPPTGDPRDLPPPPTSEVHQHAVTTDVDWELLDHRNGPLVADDASFSRNLAGPASYLGQERAQRTLLVLDSRAVAWAIAVFFVCLVVGFLLGRILGS